MAKTLKITGEKEIIHNLNKAIKDIKGDLRAGLQAAGLFIKNTAKNMTPVDTGFMKNSAFTSTDNGTGSGPRLRVGYTAKYAPWVHEMPMKLKGEPRSHFGTTRAGQEFGGGTGKGNYWDSGENKFLEKAVTQNTQEILKRIKARAHR